MRNPYILYILSDPFNMYKSGLQFNIYNHLPFYFITYEATQVELKVGALTVGHYDGRLAPTTPTHVLN